VLEVVESGVLADDLGFERRSNLACDFLENSAQRSPEPKTRSGGSGRSSCCRA